MFFPTDLHLQLLNQAGSANLIGQVAENLQDNSVSPSVVELMARSNPHPDENPIIMNIDVESLVQRVDAVQIVIDQNIFVPFLNQWDYRASCAKFDAQVLQMGEAPKGSPIFGIMSQLFAMATTPIVLTLDRIASLSDFHFAYHTFAFATLLPEIVLYEIATVASIFALVIGFRSSFYCVKILYTLSKIKEVVCNCFAFMQHFVVGSQEIDAGHVPQLLRYSSLLYGDKSYDCYHRVNPTAEYRHHKEETRTKLIAFLKNLAETKSWEVITAFFLGTNLPGEESMIEEWVNAVDENLEARAIFGKLFAYRYQSEMNTFSPELAASFKEAATHYRKSYLSFDSIFVSQGHSEILI